MEEILESASPFPKSSEDKCSIGNALRARRRHLDWVLTRDGWNDFDSISQGLGYDRILDDSSFLLVSSSDFRQDDDLLLESRIFLVDLHGIQKTSDGERFCSMKVGDFGIRQRNGQIIRFQASGEASNADLAEDAHLSGYFRL